MRFSFPAGFGTTANIPPQSSNRQRIHLINPLWDPNGGSEHRTIATYRLLRPFSDVSLWSEYRPHAELVEGLPVKRISPLALSLPFGGTLVFVGVYFRVGHWVRLARPRRVVVIYNTDQPDRLAKNLRRIAGAGRAPEVVATSRALAERIGGLVPLLESPIDLHPFLSVRRPPREGFTIGRLSRDEPTKHHDEDVELYRQMSALGCRVRIMGGTCLADRLAGLPNIELLPAGAEPPEAFLRSLDCFFYRTNERWFEAFGRVVFEAMASGLPVVCSRRGGYASYLSSGRDSLVFDSSADALREILRLRAEPSMRDQLGTAARESSRRIVGRELASRTLEYLLHTAPARHMQPAH